MLFAGAHDRVATFANIRAERRNRVETRGKHHGHFANGRATMTPMSSREIRELERRASSPWVAVTTIAMVDVLSALSFLASLN